MKQEKLRCYIAGLDRLLENKNADPEYLYDLKVKKMEAEKLLNLEGVESEKVETKIVEEVETVVGVASQFVCEECGKVARSKAGLITHKKTHATKTEKIDAVSGSEA